MRIVVDVSALSHQLTGVGNYIRGSLGGLAAQGDHELVAFAPASARGRVLIEDALTGIDLDRRLPGMPAAHALRTMWSRAGWPPIERFVGAFDVFHFGDWMYPSQRSGVRSTMIHDLVPLHHPEWVHPRTKRMHSAKYRNAARTCDVVIVNSEFTRGDVVEHLGIPPARVHVAYPGVGGAFTVAGAAHDLGSPYVLTVATLEPRKNLATLVEAWRQLGDDAPVLAVAGAPGWGEQPDLSAVVTLGYPERDRLPELYRGAAAFVYPSLFEGFGMPVIEAMACGTPCVVSSHASLDEASGDAAIRVDPHDVDAIADGIRRALAGSDDLIARGLEHVRRFTWEANARAHLAAWSAP